AGSLAGRLDVAGVVGGALLGLDPVDGRPDSLPVGPLGWGRGLVGGGPARGRVPGRCAGTGRSRRRLGARPAGPGWTRAPAPGPPAHSRAGRPRRPRRWPAAARPGSGPPAGAGGPGGGGG